MEKIGVIVPWDPAFIWTKPMFNMLNWKRPEGYELRFIQGSGWCPANRHNNGVKEALNWGADLIMFNGPDHVCQPDILELMLDRMFPKEPGVKGYDIVQAMVPSRGVCGFRGDPRVNGVPFVGLSYKVVGPITVSRGLNAVAASSIKTITHEDEPQESDICGTGNILMKADIFKGMKQPYFRENLAEDEESKFVYQRNPNMDSTFVWECRMAGASLFCDTKINILHLDVFGIDRTYSKRYEDKKGQHNWSPAKEISAYT